MEQQTNHPKKARLGYELKLSREQALRGIKSGSVKYGNLPEELCDDSEIALAAIQKEGWRVGEAVPDRFKRNKEFVLAAVKVYGCFLKFASGELRADREVVLAAVRQNGHALKFSSEQLRDDRDVVFTAVGQNGHALEYASTQLRGNRQIVLAAVEQNGIALLYASGQMRGDREIVLAAVEKDGSALWLASAELRGDREVVLLAVGQNGCALQYTSRECKNDQEIVLTALGNTENEGIVREYIVPLVSNDLQNDPVVAAMIIRKGVGLRQGSEIMERLDNVLLAVRALPEAFVKNVFDEESVVEFSRRWEQSVWQKIWMALQLEPPGMHGTGQLFVELSGLPFELRQTKELRYFAPVIGAVLS